MKILEENSINETNTSRIYQHIKGGDNFAIISAYISDNSVPKSQNERDNRKNQSRKEMTLMRKKRRTAALTSSLLSEE